MKVEDPVSGSLERACGPTDYYALCPARKRPSLKTIALLCGVSMTGVAWLLNCRFPVYGVGGESPLVHRFWCLSRLMRRYDVDRPIGEGE